jgi:DNA methylase
MTLDIASQNRGMPFHDWTGQRRLVAIGTNAGSTDLAFQGWRKFKEAFAPELVERAVRESLIPVHHVVDPFGGSGTTALAAQFLGIRSTTIEVNPFLADLIETKIAEYDHSAVIRSFAGVMAKASGKSLKLKTPFPGAPHTFVEPGEKDRYIFSREVAERICAFRAAINEVRNVNTRRLFRVLLGSSAVSASNILISGKGRRYRRNWAERPRHPGIVDEAFESNVLAALYDLRRHESRPCRQYRILRGDARNLIKNVRQIELSVFSPPYPNSFDYTDVYNVELWVVGYLSDSKMNRKLRESTIRSHVQIKRNFSPSTLGTSITLEKTFQKLKRARHQLWNKNIPEMVIAYFDDMRNVLLGLRRNLQRKGRVFLVVGDSRYANIRIPVGKIVAEEAPSLGYKVCSVEPFRSMRTSPQQGGEHDLDESLVILQAQ